MAFQEIIVASLVALAVGYLAVTTCRSLIRRRSSGCGSCSNCPSASTSPPLIQLDQNPPISKT